MTMKSLCRTLCVVFILLLNINAGIVSDKESQDRKRIGQIEPVRMRLEERYQYLREKREAVLSARDYKADVTSSSLNVDMLGVWPYGGSGASDLDKGRNIAVIGNGKAVQVLDISDPSSISAVGEVVLHEEVTEVEILGDYAYVATEMGEIISNLKIIDISTPSDPFEVGSVGLDGGCYFLEVSSNYVYAGVWWGIVDIIDVSVPSSPSHAGFYEAGSMKEINDLDVWGNYCFVLVMDTGPFYGQKELQIVDITDPSTPSFLGAIQEELNFSFSRFDVSVAGHICLTQNNGTDNISKMSVYDVLSDPANPAEIGFYADSALSFSDIVVSENHAYIRKGGPHLVVANISMPTAPYFEGQCAAVSDGWDMDYSDGYVMDNNVMYNVSVPSNPSHAGTYQGPHGFAAWYGNPIVISNDYAYVAAYSHGLQILDISDPVNIAEIGVCDTVNAYSGIALSGDYVYGTDYTGEFWVVDVSNPFFPTEIASIPLTWDPFGVGIKGNYAYVSGNQSVNSDSYASFVVYDVTDPSSPSEEGSYVCSEISRNWGRFDIEGDYLYLATNDGFRVVDISTPSAPSEVGSFTGGWTSGVALEGDYAYVSGDYFSVVDISTPSSPSEINWLSFEGEGIATSGNFVYLAISEEDSYILMETGIRVIDISDPNNPSEAGYYVMPPTYWGHPIGVQGNLAMVRGCLYLFQNTLTPEVSLSSPSSGAIVSGSVSISADAAHSSGISQVEFYVDGILEGTDTTSPYSELWNTTSVADGMHTLRARAYNNNGKSSDAEVDVTVQNGVVSYRLTIASGAGGTTDPAPGDHDYPAGTPVGVTAYPDSSYTFSGWSGDVPSGHENDNPVTITLDANKTVTASFALRSWVKFSYSNPEDIVAGDVEGDTRDEVVGDFGASGMWLYDEGMWSKLAYSNPEGLITGDVDGDLAAEVIGDFGVSGLWFYDGGMWTKLSWNDPESIMVADIDGDSAEEVVGDFGVLGLWFYDGGIWSKLSWTNPEGMASGDMDGDGKDEIVGDFGVLGLWLYDEGAWTKFAWSNPESLMTGDIDGDGFDEVVGDFGATGMWVYDGGMWMKFGWTNPDDMIAADIDGDGTEEVVGGFGVLGLWFYDGGVWSKLSWNNPEKFIAADMDGDGAYEIVGDFGSAGLWWL